MGVQGLWSLLQPAARPIRLEDLEGKRFAVDSSIWLYHFRMAMRDKEGRTLANAHILGFFWRITKLLHFGLRPVFVFDGGAPVMKRQTLIGRKARRTGAKESHALAAKKLLNAQLRQAALQHVAAGQGPSRGQDTDGQEHEWQDEDTGMGSNVVYYDEYTNDAGPSKTTNTTLETGSRSPSKQTTLTTKAASPAKGKKNIDYHRDPYALPHLDQDIRTLTASNSRGGDGSGSSKRGRRNDFRFATDSELRHLLSSITPSDIDMSSPLFKSLPFELQYELVGDMRAASRGTSYKRLQQMLKNSPTPIDFSRAQILNLKNRNELTQKVFEVTDEIGDANIKIPIRVAGERNREYVLVRREGDETGFVLGVRNQQGASRDKAIVVGGEPEHVDISSDDDEDGKTRLRRQDYEEEDEDLDEVDVPSTRAVTGSSMPSTVSRSPSNAFRPSDANNPEVRRALAEQLLTKRAQEHVREKMRERGIVNEDEILEEQLRLARARMKEGGGRGGELFTFRQQSDRVHPLSSTAFHDDDEDAMSWPDSDAPEVISDDGQDADTRQLEEDELQDLAYALKSSTDEIPRSKNRNDIQTRLSLPASPADMEEEEEVMLEDVAAPQSVEAPMEEPVVSFDAQAYADLYGDSSDGAPLQGARKDVGGMVEIEPVADERMKSASKITSIPQESDNDHQQPQKAGPVLGFRRADRPGLRAGLDPKLFQKRKWYDDDDETKIGAQESSGKTSSPIKPGGTFKSSQSPAHSPVKPSKFPEPVYGISSPTKAAQIRKEESASNVVEQVKSVKSAPPSVTNALSPPASYDGEPTTKQARVVQPALVKEDRQGRPAPSLPPLPKDDDLAASEILNAETGVKSDAINPPTNSLKEIDGQARDQGLHRKTGNQVDATVREVAIVETSSQRPLDEMSQAAAGVSEQGLGSSESGEPSQVKMVEDEGPHSLSDRSPDPPATETAPKRSVMDHDDNPAVDGDHLNPSSISPSPRTARRRQDDLDSDEGTPIEWSPSPSPGLPVLGQDGFPLPSVEEIEAMDAEYEQEAASLGADQGDIASFLSRTKGQGLLEAQAQIAREVEALRAEHVNTKKSEEEITKQMAKEIQMMLRLFGLPYITAPMEAEAQCAELVSQKLVDGIITDDSDVFLFGGTRVYKNMFNNNKVVECFLLSDLQRELGLDREKLVRLAYLLGSDYTEGLVSVGPVVAMEILSLFPGADGLLRFKEWWLKVQSGKDTPEDTKGKTMRRIKKTLANKVHLDATWPNPAVLDAYYEPAVDSSDEAFQWGLPDLDSLRTYLAEYLGWSTTKTDQYVVPVIEAQSRRSRARGNQTTLDRNGFFDVSGGTGVYAGRTLPKYGSTRLQNVVNGFRQATKQQGSSAAAKSASTGKSSKKSTKSVRKQVSRSAREEDRDVTVHSGDEDDQMSSPPIDGAGASDEVKDLLALPEEAIGKAMASRRPIVRREQMRVDDRQARDELEANIVALEGEGSTTLAGRTEKTGKQPRTTKKQKESTKIVSQGEMDEAATSLTEEEEGFSVYDSGEEFVPSTSRSKKRKTNKVGGSTTRGGGGGVGRGRVSAARGGKGRGGILKGVEGSHTESPNDPDVSSLPVRKPARARGARGGPRHANLTAARNLRLDGPLPDSIGTPLRPERNMMRRSGSSTSLSSASTVHPLPPPPPPPPFQTGTRSPSVPTTSRSRSSSSSRLTTPLSFHGRTPGDGTGSALGSAGIRERIEIELRSDEEDV